MAALRFCMYEFFFIFKPQLLTLLDLVEINYIFPFFTNGPEGLIALNSPISPKKAHSGL